MVNGNSAQSFNRGLSILEITLLSGAVAVLVYGGSQLAAWYERAVGDAVVIGQSVDISHYVREFIDCGNTFTNTAGDPNRIAQCAAANMASERWIDVLDGANAVVVSRFPTEQNFNGVRARARCVGQDGFHGVVLEYRSTVAQATLAPAGSWRFVNYEVPIACP